MDSLIERVGLLLLVVIAVAMLARRIRLPYTVALVVAGVVVAALSLPLDFHLTRELVFEVFLPPLIFEAAIQIKWKELRPDLPVTLTLATLGVLLSAGLVAVGLHQIVGWNWTSCLLLAVLISATDPVSVIATFRDLGVTGRLRLLVESESLFNDGTAAVLFSIALTFLAGGQMSIGEAGLQFVLTTGGGILCGVAVGGTALLAIGQTQDHLVEISLTSVAAYGSFLLAEHLHLSGVLATLTAGILLGNLGSIAALTDRGREALASFWEYVAFLANSAVFLLIGVGLARTDLAQVWIPAAVIIVLMVAGRAVTVYGCCALFRRADRRVEAKHQHVLFWGGLRGALALALVLGLPDDYPLKQLLLSVTFATVAFSVLVQGSTMSLLLKRLGILRSDPGLAPEQVPSGATE